MTNATHLRRLRIAFMGTRGVPARYGGFETAIEEIGRRLADKGHSVTVYCRTASALDEIPSRYMGMDLVVLPALRSRSAETLSHTAISVAHAIARGNPDVVFMFNSANAPFLPFLRVRSAPVAVHVDGLEWRRSKWSGLGRRYYRAAEALAVRWADALIADSEGIGDYYREEFSASTEPISYGAAVLRGIRDGRLAELGVTSGAFHLVVARFEPENHVDLIVRGYCESAAQHPLLVVGGAPYSDAYTALIRDAAAADPRVVLVGSLWDQHQLDQLYAHCLLYLHGHSVGGTNPSLLRAMGAGAAVSAYDVGFNREVLGGLGGFFAGERDVADAVESAEQSPHECRRLGAALQDRVGAHYRWDDVADQYELLALALVSGRSRRGEASGRRAHVAHWRATASTARP